MQSYKLLCHDLEVFVTHVNVIVIGNIKVKDYEILCI